MIGAHIIIVNKHSILDVKLNCHFSLLTQAKFLLKQMLKQMLKQILEQNVVWTYIVGKNVVWTNVVGTNVAAALLKILSSLRKFGH